MSELPPLVGTRPALDPVTFAADPIEQFRRWFEVARAAGLPQPEAAALATASADGQPSVRMVLLRGFDARGFRFFSHYDSRKGRELAANPLAALAFFWEPLGWQVRIEGTVVPVPTQESDDYFFTRAEGSRFAAAASPQSAVIGDRRELDASVARLRAQHAPGGPPRPARWGGYRLTPDTVEFWQQGRDRLHDRLRYRREGDGWRIERLAP